MIDILSKSTDFLSQTFSYLGDTNHICHMEVMFILNERSL